MDVRRDMIFRWATLIAIGTSLAPLALAQEFLPPPLQSKPAPAPSYSLQDLVALGLGQNPNLQQAGFNIQAAQGRALQSGLYPNPIFNFSGDELGDKTGPPGILTTQVSQEIVLGGKLKLNRAIGAKEIDQAALALQTQRLALLTAIREGYFQVLTNQGRVQVLQHMVKIGKAGQDNAEALLQAKQLAELDVLPLQIEYQRFLADLEVAEKEWVASWHRLAATLGMPQLPMAALSGKLEENLPAVDYERLRDLVLENHPEVLSARIGISKADLAVRRAEVEKIPNVTVGSGYTRQSQNDSNDWLLNVTVPIPVFNRNQGNVLAAHADAGKARFDVNRVQNELANRLALAVGQYAAAKQRADRYRQFILPTARRSYDLTMKAFQGGQFEYLRVIVAQRSIFEANLEYLRALGDAWRAASEIAGLLQMEDWPAVK